MKRTITGQRGSGPMTLGDLRQFVASLDGMPDEATVKAKLSFGKQLRSVTVVEDDNGFREFVKSVKPDQTAGPNPQNQPRKVRPKSKESTSA